MKKALTVIITIIAIVIGHTFGTAIVKSFFPGNNSVSFDQVLVDTCKTVNANLPMQVDKETRLDAMMPGPGNQLTYLYTLINLAATDLEPAKFTDVMKPNLINGYKTSPDMAEFRQKQVTLHYHYRDKAGNTVALIVVSPNDF